ncbi:FKBP-type peptidyl-prolyl cis-trans isomerase [Patescibacteria group bacterium]|nr:FKBP-type peptidyl-prolyl cis-trans isomerase [Patescibacteria group bacterium]
MAVALYLLRVETTVLGALEHTDNQAAVTQSAVVVGATGGQDEQARVRALYEAADNRGNLEKLVIEDITVGTGEEVVVGNTVAVHYVGRLQSGEEFDNSQKRGEPFTFTVGEGRVIAGWEQGLVGMKVGGKRILVIPAELGYGNRAVGPIPANSTLVFSIELLEIK